MGMLPITIRTRTISQSDLEFIQAIVSVHWDKSRTQISKILCEEWNWFQPNGRHKDMACREILVTLHRNGLLDLPAGKHDGQNLKRNRSVPVVEISQTPVKEKLSNLPPINLRLARNTPIEPLYNSLVQEHHHLGYRQIVEVI